MRYFLQGVGFLLIGVSWLVYGYPFGIVATRIGYITAFFLVAIFLIATILEGLSK